MEWNYLTDKKPHTYLEGDWDGKNSDLVIVKDSGGKTYIAYFCKGFMDGEHFEDWINQDGYYIREKMNRWLPIPD